MISVRNVSKMYRLFNRPKDRLKEQLFWRFGKTYSQEFWALRDISFEMKKGEALGVIGKNGSGKSTLLQIIVGTLTPTVGEVKVNGRVAALLELGSGFNPEFTGRENVYLNGVILGFTHEEMDNLFDEIADFAEIGHFMDQPVKHYSSGMFVRLAFAVQACVNPNVLIVDEALSVGDIFFQQKCIKRIQLLLENGTTLIFVTHDLSAVASLCHRTILMSDGRIAAQGSPKTVLEKYISLYYGHFEVSPGKEEQEPISVCDMVLFPQILNLQSISGNAPRYGDGGMKIIGFDIQKIDHQSFSQFKQEEMMVLILEIKCFEDNLTPNVGFQIKNRFGGIACGTNTRMMSLELASQKAGSTFRIEFHIRMMLGPGEYTLTVAVTSNEEKPQRIFDWIDQIINFKVVPLLAQHVDGLAYCPIKVISSSLLRNRAELG